MGIFKSMKDMKEMVNAAPAMIDQAQAMQANAMQMQAAMAQQAQAAQQAVGATPTAALSPELLAPIAGVTVEQYVAVVKGIAAYNYDQGMLPSIAASKGIDGASWASAAAGFNARVSSSPAFAQHFNALYRAS